MIEKRIQFQNVVQNQLPEYVKEEFPLISEFLKQYYLAQEFQGAPVDLIQNIDQYIKLDETTNLTGSVILKTNLDYADETIEVDLIQSPSGTNGFPDSYGLIKINDEIITYTGKTSTSFTGCIRGFCGITSYVSESNPEQLTFSSSNADLHTGSVYGTNSELITEGDKIENLSNLFLNEFLKKTKNQILPGFGNRNLDKDLDQNLFIKQSKDFYSSKGTDRSFEILFKALYNENVEIVRPSNYLFTPSNANYRITNDLVVESISGDPTQLENSFLFQDEYGSSFSKAYAPITNIEKIDSGVGKTFYKLSYDAGYNRDIIVDGSLYGGFKVHPKTRIIGRVSAGATVLDVDSTVGFGTSGELTVKYNDRTTGTISYTSKSLTQFYGCSGISKSILDAEEVGINTYAYGRYYTFENVGSSSTVRTENIVTLRINSVLSNFEYEEKSNYYTPKDTSIIKTLGSSAKDFISKNWFYNVSSIHEVTKNGLVLLNVADNTYGITLKTEHYFREGDIISIIEGDVERETAVIKTVTSKTSFQASLGSRFTLSATQDYKVKRRILKAQSNTFKLTNYSSNVQNVYTSLPSTGDKATKILVSSPSLPYYNGQPTDVSDRSVVFSGTFSANSNGTQFTIRNHNFYTGDAVYYIPEKVDTQYTNLSGISSAGLTVNSSIFNDDNFVITGIVNGEEVFNRVPENERLYFIKKIDRDTIKLARSRDDIFNSKFIDIKNNKTVTNNKFVPYNFKLKTLEPQKILREVSEPIVDGKFYETEPGFNGILINGVEILNYKSTDLVKYGKIEEVEVVSPGTDYDIINPPVIDINDRVGTGATGYVAVSGSLDEIRIINPGFDFKEIPDVNITGGNGTGALVSVNMKLIEHSLDFFSDAGSARISIGASNSTIGFTTYHRFRNAERVIYLTDGQSAVGGIATGASYYVSVVNQSTVKLHQTQSDAISGINTVTLTSFGVGKHHLKSFNNKSILESINVIDGGSGYANKQRSVSSSSGISTSLGQITIRNHGYNSGEILRYVGVLTSTDSPIGGISTNTDYYVTKVDSDTFKLSSVGLATDNIDFNYRTKQYVKLTSVGSGIHLFNYPPISVTISGGEQVPAVIQPIFRGSIDSIHLTNNGVGYGSSEIINLDRQPVITLKSGKNAQLYPIVNNGKITEVLVSNSGVQYNSPPDLIIEGDGIGAVVTPVMNGSTLESVKVIESGAGYTQSRTTIRVSFSGNGASFKAKIQTWRVNLFQKYFNTFTNDDGIIHEGISGNYGLQYSHLYVPRKLRETVYSVDQDGQILYGQKDLPFINNKESSPINHSPIIGWAYDGHPIYGPYGYVTKSGGIVSQMKSGYVEESSKKENRPPIGDGEGQFPAGFFVEDFTYKKSIDETVLDENNGRFCVTPEFPKGTYAYFATVNSLSVDASPPFLNYKRPTFPYLIGNSFRGVPNKFNYRYDSNQDNYDLNSNKWFRNTDPYNLLGINYDYDYISLPNKLTQTVDVTAVSPGFVDTVGIVTGGNNYKINDNVVFNNTGTEGDGAIARVSRILGKPVTSVSVATTTIFNVSIVPSDNKGNYTVICDNPHNFEKFDTVNVLGLSTTSSKIEGTYRIGIGSTALFSVIGLGTTSPGIATVGATGVVTYFSVSGRFDNVRENDILGIGTEKIKVLNVEPRFSRIRVLRAVDGTVGSSHSETTVIYDDPRRFTINAGFSTTYNYKENRQIYFNPIESVGLGTLAGVGIGTTISLANPGTGITQIFIPTKSIYIKNHNLNTGDQVTYSANNGSGLIVLESGGVGIGTTLADQQTLFVAKLSEDLIGLATVRVGLGTTGTFVGIASTLRSSTTLFFTGVGTGVYHSLKTNYSVITGEVNRNIVTVSTAQTHGLTTGHDVFVDINPSIASTFTVKYNDFNRRVIINPQSFDATGINTLTNSITINNHGFKTGQKVLHTSSAPAGGLVNQNEYFVVKVDNNNFKLSTSYYNSTQLKPSIVGISSTSFGVISPVNPPIEVYRDSTVTFDLTDSSLSYPNQGTIYPAFELNFYLDENFTRRYDKNFDSSTFEVQKTGTVGVDTFAKVTLSVNSDTPSVLYYRLEPLSDAPSVKQQVCIDDEVLFNNRIIPKVSVYNGKHNITIASTNSFTYTLKDYPEQGSYISTTSSAVLRYETDCVHAYGPITEIEIKNGGRNYYSLPGISSVNSGIGSGAILEVSSKSIGKIKNLKIKNIGFDFPSDNTLRPSTALPQIVKIDPLSSFESVGVTSFGKGYTSPPKLLVFDGKTKELMSDVDLKYTLGNNQLTILKNTYGINKVKPTILPIQNSNGVGIGSIRYNSATKDVAVTLAVGFSTADSFPFAVGDRVLIENVSVGVGSTGKGFNSENYNYNLFVLTSVDENRGGIGSVTYSLSGFVNDGEIVGLFNDAKSSGRIIPEKHFPIFNPVLKTNNYSVGETVRSLSSSFTGKVESWDPKNTILKVSSKETFKRGEILEGLSSKTQGIGSSVSNFDSHLDYSAESKVFGGWQNNSGFLNDNLQRVQDSFYYQNFSYSLKSRVDYDTWNEVVGSLNHTLGFKKFSDYQLESLPRNSGSVGLSTDIGYFEVISDLVGFGNLNCVYDFDNVRENSININGKTVSDEIIFANRILTDYEESVGNRVLSIDDLSSQFNSNPRSTAFSVVNTFNLSDIRAQKYITFVTDKRFTAQRQLLLVDLIHDGSFAYINQYGRIETQYDQGSFDFSISGTEGQLLFYPVKSSVNDYNITCLSYNLDDNLLSTGSTSIGNIAIVDTDSIALRAGVSTTIVSIANTYSSLKVLVQITPDINYNEFEFEELNIVHDGTNIELLEYGQLTTVQTPFAAPGLGTYYPYYSGSNVNVDFIPSAGVGVGTTGVINTILVGIANSDYSGIGTVNMRHARLEARTTTIPSSGSPGIHTIGQYEDSYDAAYFIVQVADTTNNNYQMSEVIVVDDYIASLGTGETYDTEFGVIETSSGLGTIGTRVSAAGTVELIFTPNPSIDTQVKVYMNALRHEDQSRDGIDFNNGTIETFFSDYTGTDRDIKRSFELKHKNFQIFERYFVGSASSVVNVSENTIVIPNHFFVSGENVVYYCAGAGTTQAIGIGTTTLSGVGSTDRLTPGITTSLYVVKVDNNKIKLATSAEKALKIVPETLDITSVGIGTSHRFVSTNQNPKVIISLDNIIQSPVTNTDITTTLAQSVSPIDDVIKFSGITSFFGSDLIKINNEILKIESIGIGSTNTIRVRRNWLGTPLVGHSTGDTVTKVVGNYNIVDNTLTFSEAPYGNTPLAASTNPPDERDWIGISTSSYFAGRTFLRSGVKNTVDETYTQNYIFDDISSGFDGTNRTFTLTSNGSNVTGITTNTVILINDVFQGRGAIFDYSIIENAGISSITFVGSAVSVTSDINTSNVPIGGIIVSVGSTEGFGYQPLVSAGGTAVVSASGTIQSISIGNSGSGYRADTSYEILTDVSSPIGSGSTQIYINNKNSVFALLNLLNSGSNCTIGIGTFNIPTTIVSVASTYVNIGIGSTGSYAIPSGTQVSVKILNPQIGVVNVSVGESSVGVGTITHIGFATVIAGSISTSVTITNPGSGYTSTNQPFVLVDDPDSYSNMPLIYSSTSSGVGTGAKIDIVVGQGSSVIDFEITNTGYAFENGDVLTVPFGGLTGIPTTSGFNEFQVTVQRVFTDEFTGWTLGELEIFDNFDELFDGETTAFQLTKDGIVKSIVAGKGSNIDVQDVILVFINDILQVPGKGYVFTGGSIITFTEAPKVGDTSKILFYKGTGSIDVTSREVIETVKPGDELTIGYDPSIGQQPYLQEDPRTVTSVTSTDSVDTIPYFGPGNTEDETLLRPVIWCRQTEDKIINGKEVGKDRELYEPNINPVAYITKSVGIGSTTIYVDNVRPFFNAQNESAVSITFQNNVRLISQDSRVGASATAIVSSAGTITSIVINDGGSGYTSNPTVSIGNTLQSIGIGTTAIATSSITAGIVTTIILTNAGTGYTQTNPPQVLISPPTLIMETNSVSSYSGDSGIIVGFGTTTQASLDKFIFDLIIPQDSFFRNVSYVGTAITLSEIGVNDYFVVNNSNIGVASTAITSKDIGGNTIGIGTRFVDNVYQVDSVNTVQSSVIGIGLTYVRRVSVRIVGAGITNYGIVTSSNYFGEFSWGKISLESRSESNIFNFYGDSGISGISTSAIVQRTKPLKYTNYLEI
jgi:hypothetical protein